MNVILESHLIPAHTLRTDDFQMFYQARKQALLKLIEKTMGKQAIPVNATPETDEEEEQAEFLELKAAG